MIRKEIHNQDGYYKLEPVHSGETSINLSLEILNLISPNLQKGQEEPVVFEIHKSDYIEAIAYIAGKMPVYTSSSTKSTKIQPNISFFESSIKEIKSLFETNDTAEYKVNLFYREDGRVYLNNLDCKGFNIRHFLLSENSVLIFDKLDNHFSLRLMSEEYSCLVKERTANNFGVAVCNYFLNYDGLTALKEYFVESTQQTKYIQIKYKDKVLYRFLNPNLEDASSRKWDDEQHVIDDIPYLFCREWTEKENNSNVPSISVLKFIIENIYKTFTINKEEDFYVLRKITSNATDTTEDISDSYRPYITAIKSKPFLLLAGISGTGKSRIVRELARACWDVGSDEYKAHKPSNFEMVQVKPNWHDSSELIGYVSRVSGEPVFVAGDFLKFVAKAWENPDVPYFLCLDEMNLAPVEQYFAEYLSVVESRKLDGDKVVTDPILKKETEQWYFDLVRKLTENGNVQERFNADGICIPQNLIVVGTVNMDETTFSFSRKVLDRAMTIEMNEVNLNGGLDKRYEQIGKLGAAELIGNAVEGVDVYKAYKDVCDKVIGYLKEVNGVLEGTPFKIAYRTRNEFLLYVVNNLPYNKDEDGNELDEGFVIARALDEITSMKILSRIEGDESKVKEDLLTKLKETIKDELHEISDEGWAAKETENEYKSVSMAKLEEMTARLKTSGYTSFWS